MAEGWVQGGLSCDVDVEDRSDDEEVGPRKVNFLHEGPVGPGSLLKIILPRDFHRSDDDEVGPLKVDLLSAGPVGPRSLLKIVLPRDFRVTCVVCLRVVVV